MMRKVILKKDFHHVSSKQALDFKMIQIYQTIIIRLELKPLNNKKMVVVEVVVLVVTPVMKMMLKK